jgi:hypothetical protein
MCTVFAPHSPSNTDWCNPISLFLLSFHVSWGSCLKMLAYFIVLFLPVDFILVVIVFQVLHLKFHPKWIFVTIEK